MLNPTSNIIPYDPNQKIGDIIAQMLDNQPISLVKDGRIIAQILPGTPARDPDAIRQAISRMREVREHMRLDGLKVKDLINEGRR